MITTGRLRWEFDEVMRWAFFEILLGHGDEHTFLRKSTVQTSRGLRIINAPSNEIDRQLAYLLRRIQAQASIEIEVMLLDLEALARK